jgi:PhzF family phenazine biosynthesis protein
VFGAGHNALGAWLWLAEQGALGEIDHHRTFHQEIGSDVLPIMLTRREGRILGCMRQSPLKLMPVVEDTAPLATALGLEACDVLNSPPPRPADTGAAHLMVRVPDAMTVDQATPSQALLYAVLREAGAEGCYVYAVDANVRERVYARFFNPTVGLWEDAATGTAAGPLAAYLWSEGFLPSAELAIEQGTKMGRPSILNIKLTPDPELSGAGVVVMHGTLRI